MIELALFACFLFLTKELTNRTMLISPTFTFEANGQRGADSNPGRDGLDGGPGRLDGMPGEDAPSAGRGEERMRVILRFA